MTNIGKLFTYHAEAKQFEQRFPNDVITTNEFRLFYWYALLAIALLTSVMMFGLLLKEFIYYWRTEAVLMINLLIGRIGIPRFSLPKRNGTMSKHSERKNTEEVYY